MTKSAARNPSAISAATRAFLVAPHALLIGGEWVQGAGREIVVENPATGEPLALVNAASLGQLDDAVAAAQAAGKGRWARSGGRDRAEVLLHFADLIEANLELVAEVMTLDNGSPLSSSRMVVKYLAIDTLRYYAGWATKISGESFIPNLSARPDDAFMVSTLREPIGVVAAIVPWNAPPGMIAMKLAPALAAGCTMIMKTAELAPLTGQVLAQLWADTDAPPGVFNLIHGFGEDVGAAMAAHPDIAKIAFTGSTEVGRRIVQAATGNLKKVSLELGGKSPVVVFPDADLKRAIPAATMACYLSTGQQCMAGSRLFVHSNIYDEVAEGVAEKAATLTVGDGMDPRTVLGPVISGRHKARIEDHISVAKAEGAHAFLDSATFEGPGHFLGPTLFTEVRPGMRIEQEEVFGPVLSMIRFNEEDELIAAINGTSYGLSGSVWTQDVTRAMRIARQVDSGQVGINVHAAMSPETPFGGNRQSGWGRELGREGLEPYLKTKAISVYLGPFVP